MSAGSIGLADLPLLLIVLAGGCPCRSLSPASERLERVAAGVLLATASLLIAASTDGPTGIGDQGFRHLPIALGLTLLAAHRSPPGPRTMPARLARHVAGLLLVAVAGGWTFGQYALKA